MKLAGRVAAAIDILAEIMSRSRPASEALKDWGKAHRFAGSADRHVIGTLVYDALRNRAVAAARGGAETPRAIVLGVLAGVWQLPLAEIEALGAEHFGPGALDPSERAALARAPGVLPPPVAGNFPRWLEPQLSAVFGARVTEEMQALCQRAPIDLRVNTLKATRETVLAALAKYGAQATALSPTGVRIAAPGAEARNINVEAEPAHGLGQFEVQDEASQLAAILAAPQPGETVLDLCAGAGGKALALAALMNNSGKVLAHDRDKHRLRPIFERITRSGATCIDVLPADESGKLALAGYDRVIVDAPCTGSGTWRRKPDAKWRLSEKQLQLRLSEQAKVLDQAAPLVRQGGRLAYFTCSILPAENDAQVQAFLTRHKGFRLVPFTQQWRASLAAPVPASANGSTETLQLTPRQHGTDGFFVALMERN